MDENRVEGHLGALVPKLTRGIESYIEAYAGFGEALLKVARGVDRKQHTVDAYGLTRFQIAAQPSGDSGRLGLSLFHDSDAGAFELGRGLKPVA